MVDKYVLARVFTMPLIVILACTLSTYKTKFATKQYGVLHWQQPHHLVFTESLDPVISSSA